MQNHTNTFYYKQNRLQQLRGFCYATQFESISKAAKFLGVTHAAVSLQIKSLEDDLKVQLFERHGPRIKLTNDGRLLYVLAIEHIEGINTLHETFYKRRAEQKEFELRIASNSTGISFILPRVLKVYLGEFKDCDVVIHYAEHTQAIEKVLSNEVDVALLPRRGHVAFPASVRYIQVYQYPPALITPKDHPLAGKPHLTVEEISSFDLAFPAENFRVLPNLYDLFSRDQLKNRLRIRFVDWETTRKYIEAGIVISISSDVIIDDTDSLVGTPLPHLFPSVDYGYIVRCDRNIPQHVEDLIETARHVGR